MNNFVKNVATGAKGVGQGIQKYGSTMVNGAKGVGLLGSIPKDVMASFSSKKKVASKMAPPTPAVLATPSYNQGFGAYKQHLDQALKY